jgi:hypothetical protein
MKLSTAILISMMVLLVGSLFATNIMFKHQYDNLDRSDIYWNYNKILQKPFKHLKIEGGNVTNIVFEQGKNSSVRVLDYWGGYQKDSVKAYTRGDTLHLKFLNKYDNNLSKSWMENNVLIRLAAPQLLSIEGSDTNVKIDQFRGRSLTVNLSGKSRLEVESDIRRIDQLNITQSDSTQVTFGMNPEMKGSPRIYVRNITANLSGVTLLDIGHIYANQTKLYLADSAALILSGKTIGTLKDQLSN